MNKFLAFVGLCVLLASCSMTQKNWHEEYGSVTTMAPNQLSNGFMPYYNESKATKNTSIAVLLPTSDQNKSIGNSIKTSIEMALVQRPSENIKTTFYDISGDSINKKQIIQEVLSTNPNIIIGPVFAEDVKELRDEKNSELPVLSFTSDISAVGNGVMTMALLPTQSIETIIRQIQNDGIQNIIVVAPNDQSGKLMASVAYEASTIYNLQLNGLFYYTPNDSNSMKDTAIKASMYETRSQANTRAKEVLSDILTKESLSQNEYDSLNQQLEKISKTEVLGPVPYNAVLFLGNGNDSKTLASFLRYYGVNSQQVHFYGTTLWQGSDIASDFTMSGAKYATLPDISENFVELYKQATDQYPDYMSSFGYDAINMILEMVNTNKNYASYLLDPSGYNGINGIFRLQPSGESERGLLIKQLNGSGTARTIKEAPNNFIIPLYNVQIKDIRPIDEIELDTRGVNPGDYIYIPNRFKSFSKYRTKRIGLNSNLYSEEEFIDNNPVQIMSTENETVISNPEYKPVKKDSISRKYIDSVEIIE
ncbi:MAG: penicillin-binding protein activator [Alphaproteobacteria bacterium]|nr:penicillin-binding protein activator [Alphaproteobacteria bacterium]